MTLITCPDCKKGVSDKADKCLSCGFPIQSIFAKQSPEDCRCSECNSLYGFQEKNCPHCGLINGALLDFNKSPEAHILRKAHMEPQFVLNAKYEIKFQKDKKQIWIAVLLGFLFGPLGSIYTSAGLAAAMFFGYLFFTLTVPVLGLLIATCINMFLCYHYSTESNEKLKASLLDQQGREIYNPEASIEPPYDIASGW